MHVPTDLFETEANILDTMRAMDSSGDSCTVMQTFHHQLAQMRRFRTLKDRLENSDPLECYKISQSKKSV